MATPVFLDTSIQIYRELADHEQLAKVKSQLASANLNAVTSHYVWMEYQRTIVADYAHIHRLMNRYEGWNELVRHLLDGSRAFRPRSAVRCTKIVSKIMEFSHQDWDLAQFMVDEQLAYGLRKQFWANVLPVADSILCDLVPGGVRKQSDSSYTVADFCRKDLATCHLPEFLHQHTDKLRAIAGYLADHPKSIKDQPRVERLLTTVLDDPRAALGQSACWPLGDVIIALQVPAEAMVWSIDADFRVLAEVLTLKRYTPSIAWETEESDPHGRS